MPRFEMKLNNTPDHAEHDWLVLENGRVVQGFATSTGAERWINDREREIRDRDRDLIAEAMNRGLTTAQFADLAQRMNGDKARIWTVLEGI